jgi:uncharacterized protein YunC (DUF1805 family)
MLLAKGTVQDPRTYFVFWWEDVANSNVLAVDIDARFYNCGAVTNVDFKKAVQKYVLRDSGVREVQ